jgi:hypothetical protein
VSFTDVFHGFGPVSDTFGSRPDATPPFPVRGMFVWVLHRNLAIQFGVLDFVWVLLGLVFGQLSLSWLCGDGLRCVFVLWMVLNSRVFPQVG